MRELKPGKVIHIGSKKYTGTKPVKKVDEKGEVKKNLIQSKTRFVPKKLIDLHNVNLKHFIDEAPKNEAPKKFDKK